VCLDLLLAKTMIPVGVRLIYGSDSLFYCPFSSFFGATLKTRRQSNQVAVRQRQRDDARTLADRSRGLLYAVCT